MKIVYKVLAYIVAALVVVQAVAMVFAVAGLGIWVEEGGVLDKSVMESEQTPFPEIVGFMIHGMNGTMVIPIVALLLLISSFFTKFPRAALWAGLVVLLVAVQIALGIFGHVFSALGALHGLNAFLLLGAATYAAIRMRSTPKVDERPAPTPVAVPQDHG
ncbi:MAG: hypothetical protein GEV07_07090 [Streptosporangiales bacterium]|nr:hypothetical protein [Streptosporangiales bacterium]